MRDLNLSIGFRSASSIKKKNHIKEKMETIDTKKMKVTQQTRSSERERGGGRK